MDPTTPRRVTRASARASASKAPGADDDDAALMPPPPTPSARRRAAPSTGGKSKASELPALPTHASQAYGSPGKVIMASSAIDSPDVPLAQALASRRGTASRPSTSEPTVPLTTSRISGAGRARHDDMSHPAESEPPLPPSVRGHARHGRPSHSPEDEIPYTEAAAGPGPAATVVSTLSSSSSTTTSTAKDKKNAGMSTTIADVFHFIVKMTSWLLRCLLHLWLRVWNFVGNLSIPRFFFLAALMFFGLLILEDLWQMLNNASAKVIAENSPASTFDGRHKMTTWDHLSLTTQAFGLQIAVALSGLWKTVKDADQPFNWSYNKVLHGWNEEMRRHKTYIGSYDMLLQNHLKRLPYYIHIERTRNGSIMIPPDFWSALNAQLQRDMQDKTPTWQLWETRNDAMVKMQMGGEIDRYVSSAKSTGDLVSPDDFIRILHDKTRELRHEIAAVSRQVPVWQDQIRESVQSSVEQQLRDKTLQMERVKLAQLAQAGILARSRIALFETNYFSEKLGAYINPLYTSPRFRAPQPRGRLARYVQRYNRFMKTIRPVEEPPITAIKPWHEEGDCFCAPRPVEKSLEDASDITSDATEQPRLQIGVTMPKPIFPTAITIEHIPSPGTRVVGAAPKDVELWVSIADPALRENVRGFNEAAFSHMQQYRRQQQQQQQHSWSATSAGAASPVHRYHGRRGDLLAGAALDDSFVLLKRLRYDHRDPTNFVQTFHVDTDLRAIKLGRGVTNAVVRVNSNWGGDRTCVYQVRLHGWEEEAWYREVANKRAGRANAEGLASEYNKGL